MRKVLVGIACCIATTAAFAAPRFEDCRTLNECLTAMDADAHSRSHGEGHPKQDAVYRAKLETFGEPAKRELLKRAAGMERAWSNLADIVLEEWEPVGPGDVPALIAALKKNPGGGVARALGRIGTPEALAALAEDIRLHGTANQSGVALQRQGERAIPYLQSLLEADPPHWNGEARWQEVANLIAEMKSVHDKLSGWLEIALDDKQSESRRVGALRVITAMGSDAKEIGPKLRVLVKSDKYDVSQAAVTALQSMADESVVATGNDCQTGDAFWENFDSAGCLSSKAAYGIAARPMAPAIFQTFSSSLSGADRANAASFAGAVGYVEARARLVEMLGDPDWRAVYAATRALGWLGAQDALPALEKVARDHWLNSVRDEAGAVIAALNGPAGNLAAPIIRPGRMDYLPNIADFEIDATMAPDVAPCASERWIWKGSVVRPPPALPEDRFPTFGLLLADGKLEGVDAGEFGGELDWVTKDGTREVLHRGNIDGLTLAPGGVVAVSNAGGIWREYEEPGKPRQVAPNGEDVETVVIGNGGGGNGYVFFAWRDASGGWRVREVLRLPRSADAFMALGSDLYVAWSGNRAIVFSLDGVRGVAECMVK